MRHEIMVGVLVMQLRKVTYVENKVDAETDQPFSFFELIQWLSSVGKKKRKKLLLEEQSLPKVKPFSLLPWSGRLNEDNCTCFIET